MTNATVRPHHDIHFVAPSVTTDNLYTLLIASVPRDGERYFLIHTTLLVHRATELGACFNGSPFVVYVGGMLRRFQSWDGRTEYFSQWFVTEEQDASLRRETPDVLPMILVPPDCGRALYGGGTFSLESMDTYFADEAYWQRYEEEAR